MADGLSTLRERWPGWQFWTVRTWDGTRGAKVWCARPRGRTKLVINAATWQDMDDHLTDLAAALAACCIPVLAAGPRAPLDSRVSQAATRTGRQR